MRESGIVLLGFEDDSLLSLDSEREARRRT